VLAGLVAHLGASIWCGIHLQAILGEEDNRMSRSKLLHSLAIAVANLARLEQRKPKLFLGCSGRAACAARV
jgi:hypothetical protein